MAAIVVALLVGWRLLAPAPAPAEMSLPYTPAASPSGGGSGGASRRATRRPASGPGRRHARGVARRAARGRRPGPFGSAGVAGGVPGPAAPPGSVGGRAHRWSCTSPGRWRAPGVQQLSGGARVVDAVDRAGGATPDADLARVNLAAPVQDGQQVYIPRVGEPMPPPPAGTAPAPGAGGGAGSPAGTPAGPVNLNTASADELDTLPGVGPATSAAIIAHRQEQGPFTSVDQLLDVRGIGDAKLAELRDLVTVG